MVLGQIGLNQHVHQHVVLVIVFDRGTYHFSENIELKMISYSRNCSNPAAQFGGIYCIGSATDTVLCNVSNVTCPGTGISFN